jgi:hypothetical protein
MRSDGKVYPTPCAYCKVFYCVWGRHCWVCGCHQLQPRRCTPRCTGGAFTVILGSGKAVACQEHSKGLDKVDTIPQAITWACP